MATAEKSRFNFTLRESLLAMVAVGALLALTVKSYERAQPFVTTGFYQLLDGAKSQTIVVAISQRLGINVDSLGAGASESSGGKSASRELRLAIRAPLEYPGVLRMRSGRTWTREGLAVSFRHGSHWSRNRDSKGIYDGRVGSHFHARTALERKTPIGDEGIPQTPQANSENQRHAT